MSKDTSSDQCTSEQQAQACYDEIFNEKLREVVDRAKRGDQDACRDIQDYFIGSEDHRVYTVDLVSGYSTSRLLVELSDTWEVESARFEYQDELEQWKFAPNQDSALLKRFVEIMALRDDY